MTGNEVAKVMETIMSIPGMNETVKIDLKISRKNVLLLFSIIERGLDKDDGELTGLLDNVSTDVIEELKKTAEECLQKAGLVELKEKLKAFTKKAT